MEPRAAVGAGTSREARWDAMPAGSGQGVAAEVGRGQVRDRGRGGGRGRGGAGVRTRGLGQGRARFGRPRRLAALVPRPGLRPGWKAEEQAVMGLRAAVFDLDGVLALPSLASSWDRAEEELALPR